MQQGGELGLCGHCQRYHGASVLRCPETGALLDLSGRSLLGRYTLLGKAGRGAFAKVWRARHVATGRLVAIKQLRLEHTDHPALRKRFAQEAKLAALIHSSHVCAVLDYLETEIGPFLVLEWVPGETLRDHLEQRGGQPMPPAQVQDLAAQVALALLALHKAGVVHRDLKPGNLMLVAHPSGQAQIKLIDFGVAKRLEAQPQPLTCGGMLLGTAGYMPPEQREDPGSVDERADIYAWGALVYRMLSGSALPKEGLDPAGLSKPLECPDHLWRWVMASLAPDPRARPASARALYQGLVGPGKEQLAPEPSPVVLRRPLALVMTGALASGLLGFALGRGDLPEKVSTHGVGQSSMPVAPADSPQATDGENKINASQVAGSLVGQAVAAPGKVLQGHVDDEVPDAWGSEKPEPDARAGLSAKAVRRKASPRKAGLLALHARALEAGGSLPSRELGEPIDSAQSDALSKEHPAARKEALGAASGSSSLRDEEAVGTSSGSSPSLRQEAVGASSGSSPSRYEEALGTGSGSWPVIQIPATPGPKERAQLIAVGDLWGIKKRALSMSFFDARQYCATLATQRFLGVSGWRLASGAELARWAKVPGVRGGIYWSDKLTGGRAQVVALPSNRQFRARLRRRFIRPFCVAPR